MWTGLASKPCCLNRATNKLHLVIPGVGSSRLEGGKGSSEVCETSLLTFILSERFQLLRVSIPPKLNSSGEKEPACEQKRPLRHELCSSFLTWSIREELNSSIICTFSLMKVRSVADIM